MLQIKNKHIIVAVYCNSNKKKKTVDDPRRIGTRFTNMSKIDYSYIIADLLTVVAHRLLFPLKRESTGLHTYKSR